MYRIFLTLATIGWISWPAWSQNATDTVLANQYYQTADSLTEQGQYKEANRLFDKAKRIYQQAEYWEKYVACFNSIAYNLWPVAAYDSAVAVAQQALQLSEQYLGTDHPEAARAYDVLGIVQEYAGQYSAALSYYQQALQVRKQYYPENHLKMADSYENLGITYVRMSEYEKALTYHKKVLAIRETLYFKAHPSLADVYNNIGVVYEKKGSYDQALYYHQQALAIREELFEKVHPHIATTYSNIGAVYQMKGSYNQALRYYQQALTIEKKLFGEVHSQVATIYNNIGLVYQMKGSYNQALRYYQQALTIKKKLFGEVHPHVAVSYSNIGLVYKEKGAYNQALYHHQQALTIQKELFGKMHPYVATNYSNIGAVHEKKGSYDLALHYHQQALTIRKKIFGEVHPKVAISYSNIGAVHEKKGSYDLAFTYYQQTLNILNKQYGKSHPYKAINFSNIGNLKRKQQSYLSALSFYQQSLAASGVSFLDTSMYANFIIEQYLDDNTLLYTLKDKAEVLSIIGLDSLAYATYLVADSLVDLLRQSYQTQDDKVSLSKKTKQVYEGAMQIALQQYQATQDSTYLQQAFYFSEKSKATMLAEVLSAQEANHFGQVPDTLLTLESSLKADRAFYQSQLSSADSSLYQEKLFITNQRYDSLTDVLEHQFSNYYQLKYADRTATVSVIQSQLSSNEAVISYFVGDSTQYAFAITADRFQVITLPTDTSLNQRIQTLRQVLHSNKSSPKEYQRQALALYQQLLAPVIDNSLLTDINRLTIIPDGALGYLPFELLLTQPPTAQADYTTLPYLIRDYTVRYGYSATWLFHPFSRPKSSAAHQYIAFAPSYPTSTLDSTQQLALGQFRDQVTPLLWNQQEAQSIGQYLPGVAYTQQAAVERRFKEEVNQYGIIHLAMHALVDDQNPMYSRLVFAPDATDTLEDSYLNAYELYDMELSADLAVLSACETGYGKLEQGEGIMSLARAFAYAGCPSIVMSHWLVDDASSARLMDHFYCYIAEGLPKDEALRQAKLAYLETASVQKAHPFFWSNFVLIGDAAPIVTSSVGFSGWLYAIGSTLLLLGLVVGVYWYQRRRTALG